MKKFTTVIERDSETGLCVGYFPGFTGAHSRAETLDERNANILEFIKTISVIPPMSYGEHLPKRFSKFPQTTQAMCIPSREIPIAV